MSARLTLSLLATLAAALSGCVLTPPGTALERSRADAAATQAAYNKDFSKRTLPEIPENPTWRDLLHRAFLANGELEAAYHEWHAALERIDMAAAYPGSNVQVGFDYMFSREKMKTFNRTTISAGFDPSMTLRLPQKVQQSGKIALEAARAAGLRFEVAKFDLQKKILQAWADYTRMGERLRIERENLQLLEMLVSASKDRIAAGGPTQDLQKAQYEKRIAEIQITAMEAELSQMRAMLNGMLYRPASAPLGMPRELPPIRPLTAADENLLALAAERNPDLARLAVEVQGRSDAIELARLAYYPDFSPSLSINGTASQAIGAMVMLPTNLPMIEGQIKESRSMLAASHAMLRQAGADKSAEFVANLLALRNAEQQIDLYERILLPKARDILSASRREYTAGRLTFGELLDSHRLLLDVRRLVADTRADREKRLAAIEAIAAVDIETLPPQNATSANGSTTRSGSATTATHTTHTAPALPTTSSTTNTATTTAQSPWHAVYTCTMHPQIQREAPGDCPICGMRLVLQDIKRKEK